MLIVRFDAPSASDETMEAVAQIESCCARTASSAV